MRFRLPPGGRPRAALLSCAAVTGVAVVVAVPVARSGGAAASHRAATAASPVPTGAPGTAAVPAAGFVADPEARKTSAAARPATPAPAAAQPAAAPATTGTSVPVGPARPPTPGPTRAAAPAAPAAAPAPAPAAAGSELPQAVQALLSAVNGARSQHGLPALTVDPRLVTSAHRHDLAMAQADTMSHQLPGEPSAGQRMTAAGVSWTYCEENVGWSGDLSNGGVPGALSVHQQMMAEGPPPAGQSNHYSDILSAQVNRIGIDVIADPAHGKIWLTEDFAKE